MILCHDHNLHSNLLFSGSSLAHLEPEQKLFEVDVIGDDGDDDLLHHHLPTAQLNSSEVFLLS